MVVAQSPVYPSETLPAISVSLFLIKMTDRHLPVCAMLLVKLDSIRVSLGRLAKAKHPESCDSLR